MKIVRNKWIPFGKRFYAINLFGVLFAKGPCDETVVNHERIHTAQMKELAYVFFYLVYAIEWAWRIVQYRSYYTAYRNISFEREAYTNQHNLAYLSCRHHFRFVHYIKLPQKLSLTPPGRRPTRA